MIKKVKLIGLLLLLLIFTLPATAQHVPVNPYQQKVWDFERQLNQKLPSVSKEVTGTLIEKQKPALDSYGTWEVSLNSNDLVPTKVEIWLASIDFTDYYWVMYFHDLTTDEINQFKQDKIVKSCEIVTGGDYWLTVIIKFENDEEVWIEQDFTVADDASHISVDEKITQIVNECSASTPWQTALNLHDWLTHNLYYDQSYEFYGVDSILRGYGVCDAYSKSYLMLCRKAGIPVGRIRGTADGESHSWNAIQLNGNWYYVDATWDDPTSGDPSVDLKPVSGNEGYDYFCLNEDAISLDHISAYKDENIGSCTLMDMQYYIYTGEWETWIIDDLGLKIKDGIIYELENGTEEFTLEDDAVLCNSDYCFYIYNIFPLPNILAYALANTTVTLSDGEVVSLNVSESPIRVSINRNVLLLPADLKIVSENSFNNTGAKTVIIPNGCTEINANAFANSKVQAVYIPDSVSSIADDAFSGCDNIAFVTSNAYAISYASDHDITIRAN